MFRIVLKKEDGSQSGNLVTASYETEALAEAAAREFVDGEGESAVIYRPIAEIVVTRTVTLKAWKQMLKDQADA